MSEVMNKVRDPLVWIAGTGWDNVAATDRRLVEALSHYRNILWVDPPVPISPIHAFRERKHLWAASEIVADGIIRLRVPALPGVTKPVIRKMTALGLRHAIRLTLSSLKWTPGLVVVAFPLAKFPPRISGQRFLHVTDDWLAGAELMGLSRRAIRRTLRTNIRSSDVVTAVSGSLLEDLRSMASAPGLSGKSTEFAILPNGCPEPSAGSPLDRENVAGLVGQLNERLDLDVLEALAEAGVRIRVVGPRTDKNPAFVRRLDAFLASQTVEWMGPLPSSDIPAELARLGVGLTPYTDSDFNRASFPLKTLEYLSAGVAVVATDSPAVQWLETDHVVVKNDPATFTSAVIAALSKRGDIQEELERRAFARRHTWSARAQSFLGLEGAIAQVPITQAKEG